MEEKKIYELRPDQQAAKMQAIVSSDPYFTSKVIAGVILGFFLRQLMLWVFKW